VEEGITPLGVDELCADIKHGDPYCGAGLLGLVQNWQPEVQGTTKFLPGPTDIPARDETS
jgi:hypothetical protein